MRYYQTEGEPFLSDHDINSNFQLPARWWRTPSDPYAADRAAPGPRPARRVHEGAECTEFTGQEQTIAVEHAFGLASDDDPAEEATGTATTALDDLVGDRSEDGFGTVLTVFDSKASAADEAGRDANAVILAQVQRTGSGDDGRDPVAAHDVRRPRRGAGPTGTSSPPPTTSSTPCGPCPARSAPSTWCSRARQGVGGRGGPRGRGPRPGLPRRLRRLSRHRRGRRARPALAR